MTKNNYYFLLAIFGLLVFHICTNTHAAASPTPQIVVCFTPGEPCTQKIVDVIDNSNSSIFVQAYSFTSQPIALALLNAKRRGIDVKVILDKSQRKQRYSSSHFFLNNKIPVWIDTKPAIAHNKVMIVDHHIVITGSFNFTKAAQEKNAENLLIIDDKNLATLYHQNWAKRQHVSEIL